MAEGGDLKAGFKHFATKADGSEATTKDITRWFTDACCIDKKCTSNSIDIAFSKHKTKGKNTLTADQAVKMAEDVLKDHPKKDAYIASLCKACPKAHGATKTSKTGGVSKMTDASQYTGSHKERFDSSGKGKGKDGRVDKVDDSGYVGNYGGEGTFDKKK